MSPDPALVLDGRQLAIWEQTVAAADMRGLDPPAAFGFQQGIAPALPDGSYVVAPQGFFQQGAVGDDAVWVRNAFVQASQFTGGFQGAVVRLMATTYNFLTTAVLNDYCWLIGSGIGATIIKLGATGIPAIQFTNRIPAQIDVKASAGIIEPGLTISGPGSVANPTDGSIGVQMADITRLKSKVQVINCQTGHLSSNQNFWTEQADFWIQTQGCTNPAVFQTAPSGAATRTGSFARTKITVIHNDVTPGFGLGGIQLLAGASFAQGSIRQYGNFAGTGQAGVYGLYISGTAPIGGTGPSNAFDAELFVGLEYDGSGTAPGTIFLGASNYLGVKGRLGYTRFSPSSINATALMSIEGPIDGDNTLMSKQWQSVAPSATGFSGQVNWRGNTNQTGISQAFISGDTVLINVSLAIAANTVITSGETLWTMPSGTFSAVASKQFSVTYSPFGAAVQTIILNVSTAGVVTWISAGVTAPAGGSSFLSGDAFYPVFI